MKTILVPTDYSATANNALGYACEMAKENKAKLILLHAYHVPMPAVDVPVFLLSPQELEKENRARMKKLQNRITKKYGKSIKTDAIIKAAFASEEILSQINELKPDAVVMGIKGAGKVSEVLIGSNTVSVMKQSSRPLIIVPDKAKYKKVKKIIFACDYEPMKDYAVLQPILDLAKENKAEVVIFNVADSTKHPVSKATYFGNYFKDVKHAFRSSDSTNIVEAINNFAAKNNGSLVAMVGRKYSFIETIFHRSKTKALAFHSKTPILSLHE